MAVVEVALQAKAIRLLAQREHSRVELARKLSQSTLEADSTQIATVLDQLEQAGYLSDERFADVLVRSVVNRGYGPLKLAQSLRDKGITTALAESALQKADIDWLELAKLQREKKFGVLIPKDFKERARQSRFLAGRGFFVETINAVFHEKC